MYSAVVRPPPRACRRLRPTSRPARSPCRAFAARRSSRRRGRSVGTSSAARRAAAHSRRRSRRRRRAATTAAGAASARRRRLRRPPAASPALRRRRRLARPPSMTTPPRPTASDQRDAGDDVDAASRRQLVVVARLPRRSRGVEARAPRARAVGRAVCRRGHRTAAASASGSGVAADRRTRPPRRPAPAGARSATNVSDSTTGGASSIDRLGRRRVRASRPRPAAADRSAIGSACAASCAA